jgi:hypothetical protein
MNQNGYLPKNKAGTFLLNHPISVQYSSQQFKLKKKLHRTF